MSGYRIWPAMLLALLGGIGAATVTIVNASDLPGGVCADGLEWAAVSAIPDPQSSDHAVLADYRQQFRPVLAGCLDLAELPPLDPADVPDPRS